LHLDPEDIESLGYLGRNYKRFGEYDKAIDAFKKMVEHSPGGSEIMMQGYADLADSYRLKGDYKESERVYLDSIEYFGKHPGALGCLGNLYLEQGKYKEAEALYEKQLLINPHAVIFYGKLAHCYRRRGDVHVAEKLLWEGVRINPDAASLYAELSSALLENKKYALAEEVVKKALALDLKDVDGVEIDIQKNLLASYEGQGKSTEAKQLREEVLASKSDYFLPVYENYRKIKEILKGKNIPLIVVQYPLRDIGPLRKALVNYPDIKFVDNKEIFEEAVSSGSYDEYFTDRFAGDFGHCTSKGNHLLAQNIAGEVLKYFEDRNLQPR